MVAYALHRIGHGHAALMDGGIEAYRSRFPLIQQYPDVSSGDLSPQLDRSIFVTYEQVRDAVGQEGVFFLDVRPVTDFLGNISRWIRNGHGDGE